MKMRKNKFLLLLFSLSLVMSNVSVPVYASVLPEEMVATDIYEEVVMEETISDNEALETMEMTEADQETVEGGAAETAVPSIEAAEAEVSGESPDVNSSEDDDMLELASVLAQGSCGSNATWKFSSDGVLSIEGSGAMTDYVSNVPWRSYRNSIVAVQISGNITHIGEDSFYDCDKLASVTISGKVTSIGGDAFGNCDALESVTLPDSLTSIGKRAFNGCDNLTTITIPKNVTTIESGVFGSTGLTTIELPAGLTEISDVLFYGSDKLTAIILPDGLTRIGEGAFQNCKSLTGIVIPETVTEIGWSAFESCFSIDNISIPEGVTVINQRTFLNCKSLTNITIPENVTTIGDDVFFGCSKLSKIEIPEKVTSIGSGAFSSTAISTIELPNNITSIADELFSGCPNLNNIKIPEEVTGIGAYAFSNTAITGIEIPEKVTSIGEYAFSNTAITSMEIPGKVTSIGDAAFYECKELTSIQIPDSVESIGDWAFYHCESLESVELPENLTEIADWLFVECKSLTTVNIPENVTTLGTDAFYKCINLTDIIIPGKVTSMESLTFYGCSSLRKIVIPSSVTSMGYSVFADSGISSITLPQEMTTIPEGFVAGCKNLTSITIPDGVTSIGKSAFSGTAISTIELPEGITEIADDLFEDCENLTGITIPEDVTSIGKSAFSGTAISTIELPEGITEIADNLFEDCENLTDITIPEGVTNIGTYAFSNTGIREIELPQGLNQISNYLFRDCENLTTVNIPSNVTKIGNYAFYNCSALNYIELPENLTEIGECAFSLSGIKSINLPKGLSQINQAVFVDCTQLESVSFSENITSIGKSAFGGCTGLTEIVLPGNITSIGNYCFMECSNLRSVDISINMTSIPELTFGYCSNLEKIIIPPNITSVSYSAFNECNPALMIYGVKGTEAQYCAYRNNLQFVDLSEITYTIRYHKNDEEAKGEMEDQSVIYLSGTTPSKCLFKKKGYGFVNWNTKPDGSGATYKNTDDISVLTMNHGEVIVLYAQWEELEMLPPPFANILSDSVVEEGTEVELFSGVEGVQIYYTLDGSEPTEDSYLYTKPICIWEDTLITAIAVKEGYAESEANVLRYSLPPYGNILPEDRPEDEKEIPKELWIAGIEKEGYVYTGKAMKPEVRVYNGKKLLEEKTDYTISYKNNINANDASDKKKAPTITVKGKGNYAGTVSTTFVIKPKPITDEGIEILDMVKKYNNKVQKAVPEVKDQGKALKNKTHFTLEYPDLSEENPNAYKDASDTPYRVKVNGKGNYCGFKEINLLITNQDVISQASVTSIKSQTYTGNPIEPPVKVKYKGATLDKETDYDVVYDNNTDIGTATVKIIGKGKYIGEKIITFKIKGTEIKKAKVTGVPKSVVYTGQKIEAGSEGWETKPQLVLTVDGKEITLSEENYEVDYGENIAKGKGTIIFTGKNGYSGVLKKTFNIDPYDIEKDTNHKLTVSLDSEVFYEKGGSKPKTIVKFGDTDLTEGRDYTLSYKNNNALYEGNNSGKVPVVTIKGKGNFKGKKTAEYKILPKDISGLSMVINDKTYQNKKNAYKSTPQIVDVNGKKLSKGVDYNNVITYRYKKETVLENGIVRKANEPVESNDIVPVNTVLIVRVEGKGNYYGTISGEYRISKIDINKVKVDIPPQIYTGKPMEPGYQDIKVTYKNDTLDRNDYEIVNYSNNIEKGNATITIKGIGDFGGTKTIKFQIKSKTISLWKN